MPVVVLGAGTVAAHAVTRARAAMGGAVLVVIGVGVLAPAVGDSTPPTDLAILAFLAGSAWQIGWETRSSGWSLLRARAREARAAVEHHARVRAALDEERRQVARALHDVVAHGVSLVGVLAGAARATAPRDPAGARARLAAAAQAVADTRRELARLTAMLRSEAEEEPHASPADLMALVDLARAGGQVVLLDGSPPGAVAQGVAASAYRILQEALTNARKHAAAAPVTVRLSSDRGALTIVVANPLTDQPPGAGSGHGIAGMRERARLLDGELSAGPERDGTFVVRARLPLDELAGAVHSRHRTVTRSTP
jgi:signal transduction histidine kinase